VVQILKVLKAIAVWKMCGKAAFKEIATNRIMEASLYVLIHLPSNLLVNVDRGVERDSGSATGGH
jgi:hypothetical protein